MCLQGVHSLGAVAPSRPTFFFSFPAVPPSAMRPLLALALAACLLGLVAAQDPCAFPSASSLGYSTIWVTTRANVLSCFNSVSFSSTSRDAVVSILTSTWGGFSFHDYLSQPISPYNVQVRTKQNEEPPPPSFESCSRISTPTGLLSTLIYSRAILSYFLIDTDTRAFLWRRECEWNRNPNRVFVCHCSF